MCHSSLYILVNERSYTDLISVWLHVLEPWLNPALPSFYKSHINAIISLHYVLGFNKYATQGYRDVKGLTLNIDHTKSKREKQHRFHHCLHSINTSPHTEQPLVRVQQKRHTWWGKSSWAAVLGTAKSLGSKYNSRVHLFHSIVVCLWATTNTTSSIFINPWSMQLQPKTQWSWANQCQTYLQVAEREAHPEWLKDTMSTSKLDGKYKEETPGWCTHRCVSGMRYYQRLSVCMHVPVCAPVHHWTEWTSGWRTARHSEASEICWCFHTPHGAVEDAEPPNGQKYTHMNFLI